MDMFCEDYFKRSKQQKRTRSFKVTEHLNHNMNKNFIHVCQYKLINMKGKKVHD